MARAQSRPRARARRTAAVAVGITAVLGASASFAIAHVRPTPEPVYTVARVVDAESVDLAGPTTEAGAASATTKVRLVGIDAPDPAHGRTPAQCLATEATGYLRELLPVGTPVHLAVATGAAPVSGRTLAAVRRVKDGRLVNEALARRGLAVALSRGVDPHTFELARGAQVAAAGLGAGLFDDSLGCTIPALLERSRVAMVAATETVEFVAPAKAKPAADALAGPVSLARGTSRSLSASADPIVVAVRSAPIVHDAQRVLDDAVANADATRAALLSRDRVYQLSMKEIARRNALALERKRQLDALIRASQRKAAAEAKLADSQVLDDPAASATPTPRPTG